MAHKRVYLTILVLAVIVALAVALIISRHSGRADRSQVNGQGAVNDTTLTPTGEGECDIIGSDKYTRNYSSAQGVDQNLLSLDIYVPKTKGHCNSVYPVMIYVHGGGWQKGDKGNLASYEYKAPYFTTNGFVYVSVNYRLSPAVMYPVHNQDVATAIAWFYKNSGEYKADRDRINIMGHSAGGGIISSVATDETYLDANGLPLSAVKCAVSLDTEGYNVSKRASDDVSIYEQAFGEDPNTWYEASPINHISPNKGIPSFFIVTRGAKDRIAGAKLFEQLLDQTGTYTQLIETPSLNHEGVNDAIGDPADTLITPKLQEFLDSHCI